MFWALGRCCHHFTVLSWRESSLRQYINEGARMWLSKTVYTEIGFRPDWAVSPPPPNLDEAEAKLTHPWKPGGPSL